MFYAQGNSNIARKETVYNSETNLLGFLCSLNLYQPASNEDHHVYVTFTFTCIDADDPLPHAQWRVTGERHCD